MELDGPESDPTATTRPRAHALAQAMSAGVLACLSVALFGCASYTPTLHLERSLRTIPATLYVEPLEDISPPDDRRDPDGSTLSQTNAQTMEGELSALLTKAIRADLSASSVFHRLALDRGQADLVLTGRIHRFYGFVTLPSWLTLPGLSLRLQAVWGFVQSWAGEVDLELTLSRPDGVLIATYRGTSQYREVAAYDHRYWAASLYPAHARLNQAFTDAVRQITDQMLHDQAKMLVGEGAASRARD